MPHTDLLDFTPNDLAPQEFVDAHPLQFESPSVAVTRIWHRRYDKDATNQRLRGLVKECLGTM